MAVTAYTTASKINDRLSAEGVTLRTDDDATVTTRLIANASTRIDFYLRPRYSPTQLAASDWVSERATDIAAWLLCARRANPFPKSIQAQYEQCLHDLELVRTSAAIVPDIPQRKEDVPVLSQPRVRLDPFPRTVIEPNRSTGTAEGYPRHEDGTDTFDYGSG